MTVLRIGTRKSVLAMKQTALVCEALAGAYPNLKTEIIKIETLGDKTQKANLTLAEHGGKALWASEHEAAMRAGLIDCAVHSVKDIPGILDPDMIMPVMLPREDPRDVFLSSIAENLTDLPTGARLGTSSPRRAAMALQIRPDLNIVNFRGNIGTRLEKLAAREVDATFLAAAGLKRSGFSSLIRTALSADDFLPAVGQGAIGIEFSKDRTDLAGILDKIHCAVTGLCVKAERAWLAGMGGSCRSPLAALAEYDGVNLRLRAFASTLDGKEGRTADISGIISSEAEAEIFGFTLAERMRADLPKGFI